MKNETTLGVGVALLVAALLACNESSSSSPGYESRPASRSKPVRDEQAHSKGVYAYRELMGKVESDAPGMLSDMVKDAGRNPDRCENVKGNEVLDVCYWFFTPDDSVKAFTATLAAEGGAGSNPNALVKQIVFARNNEVEKKIDGAVQQLLDRK